MLLVLETLDDDNNRLEISKTLTVRILVEIRMVQVVVVVPVAVAVAAAGVELLNLHPRLNPVLLMTLPQA
jgi:hypothetical protein